MLLCKIEVPFAVGIGIKTDINITTECQNRLFGVVRREWRFPVFESINIELCELVTDTHHFLKVVCGLLSHERHELTGLVDKRRLTEFSGDCRSIEIQRFSRGNHRQHGIVQRF